MRELINLIGFKTDTKSLKNSEQQFQKMKTTAKNIAIGFTAIASVVSAIALGIYKFTEKFAETGDEIAKTARDIGLTGESLQKWQYASELAGVSQEEFNTSLKFFSKELIDASNGIGMMKDSLAILGINLKDGNGIIKDNNVLLFEIAEKLKNIPDAATRAKVATDLFGRSGIRMSQLLGQGSNALEKFMKEAEDLGLIISEDTLIATEELNDNILRLQSSFKGITNILGNALLPIVNKFVLKLTDLIKKVQKDFKGIISGLVDSLTPIFDTVLSMLEPLFKLLVPVLGIVSNLLNLVAKVIGNTIMPFINSLANMLSPLLNDINNILSELFKTLEPIISILLNVLIIGLKKNLYPLLLQLKIMFAFLQPLLKILGTILNPFLIAINKILEVINKLIDQATLFFYDIIGKGIDWIKEKFSGVGDWFKNIFSGVSDFFTKIVNNIIDGINWLIEKTNKIAGTKLELIQKLDTSKLLTKDVTNNNQKNTNINLNNNINVNNPNGNQQIKKSIEKAAGSIFNIELKKILMEAGGL